MPAECLCWLPASCTVAVVLPALLTRPLEKHFSLLFRHHVDPSYENGLTTGTHHASFQSPWVQHSVRIITQRSLLPAAGLHKKLPRVLIQENFLHPTCSCSSRSYALRTGPNKCAPLQSLTASHAVRRCRRRRARHPPGTGPGN